MRGFLKQISSLIERFEPWLEALAQELSHRNYLSRGLLTPRGPEPSPFLSCTGVLFSRAPGSQTPLRFSSCLGHELILFLRGASSPEKKGHPML